MASTLEKLHPLERISPRIVYFLIFIICIAVLTRPIGLPVPITQRTIEFYNRINSLPPGTVVLFSWDALVGQYINVGAGSVAVIQHLFRLPVKVIFVGFIVDSVMLIPRVINDVDKGDKKYGEDWVFLGYAAGDESAVATLAKNFWAVYKTDTYGTPIENIPMMKNIRSATDIGIVITALGAVEYWLRQWYLPYKTPLLRITMDISLQAELPYYYAGQIVGLLTGMRGAAEYEQLIGKLGRGMASQDSMSLEFLLMASLMFLGTIGYTLRRTRREKK